MTRRHLLIVVIVSLLLSCENEHDERIYPQAHSFEVTEIDEHGLTFSGSVSGDFSGVTDHGFVWGEHKNLSIRTDATIKLGKPSSRKFHSVLRSGMTRNNQYFFAAYVTVGEVTIYGESIDFVSLGVDGPVITRLSASEGQYLDTLEIFVKNLSGTTPGNKVFFADNERQIISATDSSMSITLPLVNIPNPGIYVSYKDNKSPNVSGFVYHPPVLLRLSPEAVTRCDTVLLIGKYLPRDKTPLTVNFINSDGYKAGSSSFVSNNGNDTIRFTTDYGFTTPIGVQLEVNSLKFELDKKIGWLATSIESIEDNVSPDDVLHIYGEGLPFCSGTILLMGAYSSVYPDVYYEIIGGTSSRIDAILHGTANSCIRPRFLLMAPFQYGVQQFAFHWKDSPSIFPGQTFPNASASTITIQGEKLDQLTNPSVLLRVPNIFQSGIQLTITSISATEIKVEVPDLTGRYQSTTPLQMIISDQCSIVDVLSDAVIVP